jgi:dTDP-glucose 4,6-dehydratase
MNLLITGSAGFIGSHFAKMACENPEIKKIVSLDCITYAGSMENLPEHPKHHFIRHNIRSSEGLHSIFKNHKISHVVHMAAESHVDRSIEGPTAFIKTNINGTFNMLEAARLHGVKRFINVSTDEVYGSVTAPATREHPLNPSSPYSASKASADMLCIAYGKTFKLEVVITRCVNNYGPRQFAEKLIPVVIKKALAGEPIPVYGTGENIRDWIHVEDHCSELMTALTNPINPSIIHIAGGNEIRNIDLVRKILKLCNASESLIRFVEDRKGHDERYSLQAVTRTGYVDFHSGLARTVEWYRHHFSKSECTNAGQPLCP